jgi:chromosome segregation ATPase
MEINENEFKYLVPTNKDNSLWDFTLFAEFTFETSNFQDYTKEREKLEKELEKLQERIDQEIALTEKITNSIKAKSSDTAKDLNALKDIEIQWRTAQVNIDNIKKMMVPKVNRIKELEEKIIDEKVNSIESIRNEFVNKLNDTISSTEEQLNLMKDKIESLY